MVRTCEVKLGKARRADAALSGVLANIYDLGCRSANGLLWPAAEATS